MKIYTSSWFGYKGAGRIGISRGVPRFNVPAGYRIYRTLAPSHSILKESADKTEYEARFFAEVLDLLDPHEVISDLKRLADGHDPVLLCYERPPFTFENFCHRHMVSDWLNRLDGIECGEWSGAQDLNPRQCKLDV